MALVLNVLLEILRILRIARDYIKRFPGRGASLLALLRRKLIAWWRFWRGKKLGGPKPAKRPIVGTQASSHSVSSGSAVVGGYVVAASYVPSSASHPSLHEHTDGQQQRQLSTVVHLPVSIHPPANDTLSVGHPHHNLAHALGTRGLVNRSSGNLSIASIQSRASDRFSIITTSRDSIRAPHGQPSRLPRAAHRQFGRGPTGPLGPEPSRSRERLTRPNSRPNTPSIRAHTPPNPPYLEIITNTPSATDGSGRVSPLVPPSASSAYTHEPLSPPEVRRRQSSTSFVVDVQNPSTDSLPISPSTTNPPVSEEPLAIDSATAHSSPDSDSPVVDQHDEPPGSPTTSNAATLDYYLPEGRFVQLINSDQIPRYTKEALMQVEFTILLSYPYTSL